MAHLYRLSWLLLVGAVLWLVGLQAAHASYPATPGSSTQVKKYSIRTWNNSNSTATGYIYDTPTAACNFWLSERNANKGIYSTSSFSFKSANETTCVLLVTPQSGSPYDEPEPIVSAMVTVSGTPYCAAGNSTLSGTTCTCNSGYTQGGDGTASGTTCTRSLAAQYCADAVGQWSGQRVLDGTNFTAGGAATYCISGLGPLSDGSYASCASKGTVDTTATYGDKKWAWSSDGKYDGTECNPNGTGTVNAQTAPNHEKTNTGECTDASQCAPPKGMCTGTVNGTAIFVPCSNTTSQTTKTTEKPPNADGTHDTEKTTTTTTCTNGVCTTTSTTSTTTTTSTGTVTGTVTAGGGSTTSGKGEYCKGHPEDPQCGDVNSWGGTCAAGFTCDGDATLCAAAKGLWLTKCALVDGPTDAPKEKTAYAAAAAASSTGVGSSTVSISQANFDSSNALGQSASCPADLTITVWGTPQVIEVSKVCPWLQTLGTIMLALSWLGAAVIVGKGVQG